MTERGRVISHSLASLAIQAIKFEMKAKELAHSSPVGFVVIGDGTPAAFHARKYLGKNDCNTLK
jgi:hypothetical protein